MIIVASEEIVFDSAELAQLDAFLKSYTGRRMIQAVAALRPTLTGDPFMSGRVAGYEEAVINLLELTGRIPPLKEDSVSNYPDLDDDEKWREEVPRQGDAPHDDERIE